jgi:hypothetical protein
MVADDADGEREGDADEGGESVPGHPAEKLRAWKQRFAVMLEHRVFLAGQRRKQSPHCARVSAADGR